MSKRTISLMQEGSERIAARHAPTRLAADHFPVGTGGVLALGAFDQVVTLVQLKNNSDHVI